MAWVTPSAWALAFNSSDISAMNTTLNAVLSSVADITNGTGLNQFIDLSIRCTIPATSLSLGDNVALYRYDLLDDGTTYGDGQFTTPGAAVQKAPSMSPSAYVTAVIGVSTQTTVSGLRGMIMIPPGSFRFVFQNNTHASITSAVIKYRMYS